ncbi:MAG: hypothetical protein Q8N26_31510 [Myxococcales bacterium]|nr:hypothetical protein [Myxococcales bacterium]
MNRTIFSALFLLAACQPVLPDVPRSDGGTRQSQVFKHAHNDYEHPRPLFDALDAGFESVEVDVWIDGTDIGVSHTGAPFKGSLKALYLDPLAQLVRTRGRVNRSGGPFFLWLDLKQGDQRLLDLIATQLAEYPMLTRFQDDQPALSGAVTVILTGSDSGKKALVERPSPRPYIRDSNSYSPMDPQSDSKWGAYALNYNAFMQWDGQGTISAAQQRQLDNLVAGAHQAGRQVRLYAAPETPAWWRVARKSGVDFVGGDDLSGIASVFAEPILP